MFIYFGRVLFCASQISLFQMDFWRSIFFLMKDLNGLTNSFTIPLAYSIASIIEPSTSAHILVVRDDTVADALVASGRDLSLLAAAQNERDTYLQLCRAGGGSVFFTRMRAVP